MKNVIIRTVNNKIWVSWQTCTSTFQYASSAWQRRSAVASRVSPLAGSPQAGLLSGGTEKGQSSPDHTQAKKCLGEEGQPLPAFQQPGDPPPQCPAQLPDPVPPSLSTLLPHRDTHSSFPTGLHQHGELQVPPTFLRHYTENLKIRFSF